jgi:DNA-binding CsgD family transcriptional regulator
MGLSIRTPAADRGASLSPLPLSVEHWEAVIGELELSPRQAQIAELMVRGAQLKEIAAILGIKACTVRGQQERMYAKLGIRGHAFFAHVLGVSYELSRCRCRQK